MKTITGNNAINEIKAWEKLLQEIESIYQPQYFNAIEKAMKKMIDKYEKTNSKDFAEETLLHAVDIEKIVSSNWSKSGRTFSNRILESINSYQEKGLKEDFLNLLNVFKSMYLAEKVTKISETTKNQIKNIIEAGEKRGDTLDVISEKLRDITTQFSLYRSHMIARTETHQLANYGNQTGAELSDIELEKKWIYSKDHRTRDSKYNHRINQQIPLKDDFIVSGERLKYPGDQKASAGNVINCRCVVGYIPVE